MSTGILRIEHVKIPSVGEAEENLLVIHGDVLAAVLVYLDAPVHRGDQGRWHLEADFGRCAVRQVAFDTLELKRFSTSLNQPVTPDSIRGPASSPAAVEEGSGTPGQARGDELMQIEQKPL